MKGLGMALVLLTSTSVLASELVVNQLGFVPQADKKVFWVDFVGDAEAPELVELVSMNDTRKPVSYSFSYNSLLPDGQSTMVADFSSLNEPGWYYFQSGETKSPPFEIKSSVYQDLHQALVHALFLQRSGQAVYSAQTGMARPPSHMEDGVIFRSDEFNKEGTKLDGAGGWYDAGDFGKYIATATITIARMLEAYRQAPELYPLQEPNKMPTILVEALYGIEWMEKMHRQDGAVYRKLSGAVWPAKIPPWLDNQVRYVYGVSTSDTAKFAATMAFAARTYQPFDKALAERFLKASSLAWAYLESQPEQYIDWQKEDDSGSGPYILNQYDKEESLATDLDDRLWAAAELYVTTRDEKYLDFAQQAYDDLVGQSIDMLDFFEWKNPAVMGVWHLMLTIDSPFIDTMKSDLHAVATRYAKLAEPSPFFVANQRFVWGSNKMVAEIGILLAWSDLVSGRKQHRWLVQAQLDYLLGSNAFNMSYVTHFGTYAVRNLHHLYRIGTGVSLPGFLVGGPNIKAQANVAPKNMGMQSYVDDEKSYAVNEFAIDYNAALIGLLAVHSSYFD